VVSYTKLKSYVIRALLLCVVLIAVVYMSDYLIAQYRASHGNAGSVYGTVTVYLATEMKNGQVQLFYRNPMPMKCVRTLFPQLGYTPCWYLSRSPVKMVS
jgi:hypothetical protein